MGLAIGGLLLLTTCNYGQVLTAPRIEWQKVYGGTESDGLSEIWQTADGGFIVGGISDSPANGNKTATNWVPQEYWIVRLDEHGDHLWDQSFCGNHGDYLASVRQTTTGGFIIGGTSLSGIGGTKTTPHFGNLVGDYWVIRVDDEGHQIWEQNLGGTGGDYLSTVLETIDGQLLVAGSSASYPSGNKTTNLFDGPVGYSGNADFWLVRLDTNGNKLSEASYGGILHEELSTAILTRDGGFLLGGESQSSPSGNKTSPYFGPTNYMRWTDDMWIVRLDSNSVIRWDKSFGGASNDILNAVAELPDGGFALAGSSQSRSGGNKTSPNFGGWDWWLIRIDEDGNKVWEQSYGGSEDDFLVSVVCTTDGGLLLGGFSFSPASGNKVSPKRGGSDYWVIRLDVDGNRLWEETYGGSDGDGLGCLQQTRDGGFILGGSSSSPADGNKTVPGWFELWEDFWLVKLAPEQPKVRLLSPDGNNENWRLALYGVKNLTYAIEYSGDLAEWTPFATNRLSASMVEIADPSIGSDAHRFFRARRLP